MGVSLLGVVEGSRETWAKRRVAVAEGRQAGRRGRAGGEKGKARDETIATLTATRYTMDMDMDMASKRAIGCRRMMRRSARAQVVLVVLVQSRMREASACGGGKGHFAANPRRSINQSSHITSLAAKSW